MPFLAAIPAAIGAGLAIADAVDSDETNAEKNARLTKEQKEGVAEKDAFLSPMGANNWGGMSGIHGDWQGVGKVGAPDAQGVYSARGQRYGSRAEEGKALGLIQQYATGQESAARREASNAVDQAQTSMASQAAAAGSSPAAQRAAMYGQAAMGQNVAGTTAAAAAKEQLGAQQAYLTGAGARRQQDIASQLAEQQWYGQQGAFALGANQQKQSALGLGMQQADTERKARMQYQAMLRGYSMDQQQLDEQKRQTNLQTGTNIGVGAANALSNLAASDRSVKKNVSTPAPEDIFGSANDALVQRDAASEAARAGAGARFDPNWQDLYSEANQDVFSSNPYNQDWDQEAQATMGPRAQALGKKQAAANAQNRANMPTKQTPQWDSPTMNAIMGGGSNATLNSLYGKTPSDEKVKKGIKGLSDEELSHEVARRAGGDPVRALLDSVDAKKYRYKDPDSRGARPGEQIGVMAQDLEKTPAGAALVSKDGPGGTRMVDYVKSLPLIFAAAAQLNDRVNQLEGKGQVKNWGEAYAPFEVNAGRSGAGRYAGERTRPRRTVQPPAPVTSPGVAVLRGGQPVPGSNLATAQWLQGQQGAPAWGPDFPQPQPQPQPGVAVMRGGQMQPGSDPSTAAWLADEQANRQVYMPSPEEAAYLAAMSEGLPPPGMGNQGLAMTQQGAYAYPGAAASSQGDMPWGGRR